MRFPSTPIFKFGSHLPVLIKCMAITSGPALEMGMGMNSSIVMHWMCADKGRELVSYEDNLDFNQFPLKASRMACAWHRVLFVKSWDEAEIERPWDVALIDHAPAERRIVDIRRLANWAKYIVVHDAEGRAGRFFHYEQIFPLFKWQWNYNGAMPKTSVFSNFVDLSGFTVDLA